jgi:hypothetical protein
VNRRGGISIIDEVEIVFCYIVTYINTKYYLVTYRIQYSHLAGHFIFVLICEFSHPAEVIHVCPTSKRSIYNS